MEHEDKKQKVFERRLFRLAVFETPGTILVGLGAYGRFWAEGDAFWSLLDNPLAANAMLAIGVTIWLACWTEFFKIFKSKDMDKDME